VAEWKMKKEASLHGGAEDSGQPEEEEEDNIYIEVPEPEVRERCIYGILHVERWEIQS
jgi:hypothetical protein